MCGDHLLQVCVFLSLLGSRPWSRQRGLVWRGCSGVYAAVRCNGPVRYFFQQSRPVVGLEVESGGALSSVVCVCVAFNAPHGVCSIGLTDCASVSHCQVCPPVYIILRICYVAAWLMYPWLFSGVLPTEVGGGGALPRSWRIRLFLFSCIAWRSIPTVSCLICFVLLCTCALSGCFKCDSATCDCC